MHHNYFKRVIYVGCALTTATDKLKTDVGRLKTALRDDYHVLDFIGLVNGTPTDVYRWDIHRCVATCELLIAICDESATGLGYEMGVAVEKRGIPVIAVAHSSAKVTRLVVGVDHPRYQFLRCDDILDLLPLVGRMLPANQQSVFSFLV